AAYRTKAIRYTDLIDKTISRIKLLISDIAIKAYRNGALISDELKNLDDEKCEIFIKCCAKLDKSSKIEIADLNIKASNKQFKLSLLKQISIKLCNECIDIDESIDEEKIDIFLSPQALDVYKLK